jgi:plastocyanin
VKSKGISTATTALVVLIIALAVVTTVYVDSNQGNSDQISSLQSVISNLTKSTSTSSKAELPVVNQPPTIRTVRETWYLSPSAHQDRFDPSFIVVNQGDTVRLTLIDNDTVAHDFVIGPPYNILVNATVPGLINDLTGKKFTTNATNNSPGAHTYGKPGNVSATYSFVAVYAGIYEFVCTYHAEVGMIGYLVVLPNLAYTSVSTATQTSEGTSSGSTAVAVSILSVSPPYFSPDNVTVVIGFNNTLIWTNNDVAQHTVSSTSVPSGATPFDSGVLNQGGTFSYVFTVPGVYEYHCLIHPWMTGTVIVKAQT